MPSDLWRVTIASFSGPSGSSSAASVITYCAMIRITMLQCRNFATAP